MSNAIALRSVGTLDFERGFSGEQIQLLKDTIAKEATDAELQMFMYVCQRRRLDPFAKQVYPVKRYDSTLKRYTTAYQTGIDGFRVIAQRTGKYRGQVGPFWCGKDGVWKDVWLDKEPPAAAKVGVKHADYDEVLWGVATWDSYVQVTQDGKVNSMWQKMCDNQLAKCAESLAFRKAFPEDLGGLHTDEEMGQADNGGGGTEPQNKVDRLAALNKKPEAKDVVADVAENLLETSTAPETFNQPEVLQPQPASQGPKPEPTQTVAPKVGYGMDLRTKPPEATPEPNWGSDLPSSVSAMFDPLADYKIKTTSPYKDHALKSLPREGLVIFLSKLRQFVKDTGKPLTGPSLEDASRIDDYLRTTAPPAEFAEPGSAG